MASRILVCLLFAIAIAIATVDCNLEGDALNAWKSKLVDPNNVLQSWDPVLVNPCTWFHITCNNENSVTRVDLADAGLSGPLVPQLGLLSNLQYLEVFNNSINGTIPNQLGNLKSLISLGLHHNQLTGYIPTALANLKVVRFMRLNSNKLNGTIPIGVLNLINTGDLRILDVSDNFFTGTVHGHNSTVTKIIQDPKAPPK